MLKVPGRRFVMIFALILVALWQPSVWADEVIITANQNYSVVQTDGDTYIWRTKYGKSGKEASAKDAKKAAKKSLKKSKKEGDGVVHDPRCDGDISLEC